MKRRENSIVVGEEKPCAQGRFGELLVKWRFYDSNPIKGHAKKPQTAGIVSELATITSGIVLAVGQQVQVEWRSGPIDRMRVANAKDASGSAVGSGMFES